MNKLSNNSIVGMEEANSVVEFSGQRVKPSTQLVISADNLKRSDCIAKHDFKVLFIGLPNAGSRPGKAGLFIPLGLSYLSAALKNQGYKYDCIDLHTEQILRPSSSGDLWNYLNCFDFSSYNCVALGGVFLKIKDLRYISEMIRDRNPSLFQIVGGQMATIMSDLILKTTTVDCVGLFEGEETIVELVKTLETEGNWQEVKGIKFRSNNDLICSPTRAKLTAEKVPPLPDRENWEFNIIRKAYPVGTPGRYSAVIFASRGCPFRCTFCNPLSGKEIRSRNVEDMIYEIKYLKKKWNVQYFRFFDEVFIGSKKQIRAFCEALIEEKLDIFWSCQTQVRLVDNDLVKHMKKAGCILIQFGIESGSASILNEMKKGATPEVASQAIEWTHQNGISSGCSMIAGFPSETVKTIEESRDFIISLNHVQWDSIPEINYVVPLPNTELFRVAIEKGLIKDPEKYVVELMSDLGRYKQSINLTEMTDKEMKDTVDRCNKEIVDNFYRKHPVRFFLSLVGLDHLGFRWIFHHFSWKQILPLLDALAWSLFNKRLDSLRKHYS